MELRVGLFLHHFQTRPTDKARWLSLIRHQERPLLRLFSTSYKNFKVGFFKVVILPGLGDNHFYDINNKPLFPFYCQQVPRRYGNFPKSYLTDVESRNLILLDKLP